VWSSKLKEGTPLPGLLLTISSGLAPLSITKMLRENSADKENCAQKNTTI
jgi:hypothetical protein